MTFAQTPAQVSVGEDFTKVVGKTLAAGSWAVVATANSSVAIGSFAGDRMTTVECELRNGSNFIGRASSRHFVPDGQTGATSLPLNGGAQVPLGGGEVSLWCRSPLFDFVDAQLMLMKVGGFS